ncbi:MAG: OPT/YSL family transporter [Polyangiaceae bacterium]|nr:OPT/YSL family transporter [Polyangiaceae bacterium]
MKKEITWQSVSGAFFVSALISLAYPYIVLKLGMGPNVSVLAAFIGALYLYATARKTRGQNAVQNNIIQTAATSATATAFMCVVAAAFGYLNANESVNVKTHIDPWNMFLWLSCSGAVGVLVAALFRRYFIDDPEMIFADGVAAAETIQVLDAGSDESRHKLRALGVGTLVGMVLAFVRDGLGKIPIIPIAMRYGVGIELSVLSVGTGLLISLNVGLSMLAGSVVTWLFGPMVMEAAGMQIVHGSIAPQYVAQCDALASVTARSAEQAAFLQDHCGMMGAYLGGKQFSIVMLWFMWPATAMMITSAMTAVALQWRSIASMFTTLKAERVSGKSEDMSLRTILILGSAITLALAFVQAREPFNLPFYQTIISVLCGLPLILVGVRVLGETNQGPVSLMANTLQAIFRLFSADIGHNLVSAGTAGNINSQGEGTMQVYKTGKIVGSVPRVLTWVQFASIPIGAAAVAIMYPVLIRRYGLGGDGLAAPTGLKLANMAVLMTKGISAFPKGALTWTAIAAVLGVVIELLKQKKGLKWLPSVAGFGFALILPGTLNIPIAIGAIAGFIWHRVNPRSHGHHSVTLASGFIGGEALIAGLLLPALFYFGLLSP